MPKIKIAKVIFNKNVGHKMISKINNDNNWRHIKDFHVTCTFLHKDESLREDKVEVIGWCEHLLSNGRSQVEVEFDGIYQGQGCIFAGVKSSSVEGLEYTTLPRPSDQILHMTLLVDVENGHKPKDSLLSLQKGNYGKILDLHEFHIGRLVIEEII